MPAMSVSIEPPAQWPESAPTGELVPAGWMNAAKPLGESWHEGQRCSICIEKCSWQWRRPMPSAVLTLSGEMRLGMVKGRGGW